MGPGIAQDLGGAGSTTESRKNYSGWHKVPIAGFVLGLLSIVMIFGLNEIKNRQRENAALADVVMNFQLQTALAHLWLEEALTEDVEESIITARLSFDRAVELLPTLLHGGKSDYGIAIPPPESPEFLQQAEKATSLLVQFKQVMELRYANPRLGVAGSDLDDHFDAIFDELRAICRSLEDQIEKKEAKDFSESTRLFVAVTCIWSLIVAAGSAGIWYHESRRKRAEQALQRVNEGLEIRVAERTRELQLVNDRLTLELTERRLAEEALRASEMEAERSARLASLGELAAGVAHEINNPVAGIIGCAEILANLSGGEREREIGRRITREGSRIAYIVKSLLSFARERSEEKGPVRLGEILADTLTLTEAQLRKEGIALKLNLADDLPVVLGQPQQLEQVFLNIINNARDALNPKFSGQHEEKLLRITGERVQANGRPHVRLSFYDQGTGIPAHLMNKIANPFFSTKPKGKGTGLGLSISHGIIDNHGGKLTIQSVEGSFTEVTIDLPEGG